MKYLLLFLSFAIICTNCSKKADIDPSLQIKANGLFTYTIVSEGDGKVDFKADSTQNIKEFIWDFGDGSAQITAHQATISHDFTKNTSFQVKLTAKNNAGQVSDTKAIVINSRLARSIEDVPANELNKIRILHIILGTEKGFNPEFDIKNDPFNYINTVFQQFISNHPQPHNAIYNYLTFENYFYKVNSEDSTFIYNNQAKLIVNSRSNFLIDNIPLNETEKVIFNKLLQEKIKTKASLVVFWLPYNINAGGYAQMYGRYAFIRINNSYWDIAKNTLNNTQNGSIVFFNGLQILAHELGHNFSMNHDAEMNKGIINIMSGVETKIIAKSDTTLSSLPFFQIKDWTTKHTILSKFPVQSSLIKYQFTLIPNIFIIDKLKPIIPNLGENNFPKGLVTSGGTTFFTTLESHLIDQYNIKIAPNKVKSFANLNTIKSRLSKEEGLNNSIE
jgi:PKD repeat protein